MTDASLGHLVAWAQFVFWCVATGVGVCALLLLGRLSNVLDRWAEMAGAVKTALIAARFLPDAHAGQAAPSTFPPRDSNPNLVALERRHEPRPPPDTGLGGIW